MRALSLWQPWATAMALGLKRIETRHWATSYRGPLAIHAAKRWTREERELLQEMIEDGFFPAAHEPLPFGAVVAVGRLVDIKRTEQLVPSLLVSHISDQEEAWGNYGPYRYGWIFEDVVPLAAPIPFKGMQGIFDVPADVLSGLVVPPAPPPIQKPAPVLAQGLLL